ncbi:MAG: DUF3822 family protein [Bacteroidales bacterium]|nr:DUF3822 family protein [Bacteroidales bacterium]
MNGITDSGPRHITGAPDLSDTGQWRLIIYLAKRGMSAWIKSTEDPTARVGHLFTSAWEHSEETLLRNIENTVYDHPRILDDYSADIIIETEKCLWVPAALTGENPEAKCEEWFTQVWAGTENQFLTDECGDKLCLHLLADGLKDFLSRTFAGTRISSHQTQLVRNLAGRAADDTRTYVDIRDHEADFVIFSGKNLLVCVTKEWYSESDIVWHLFNLLEIHGIDPRKAQVCLSGKRTVREQIARETRPYLGFLMLTMVPRVECDTPLPLGVVFCAARNNNIKSKER